MEIFVNGKSIIVEGGNVRIRNGEVIVDGKTIETGLSRHVEVTINGNVEKIDCAGSVTVNGDVSGNIDCGGSCTCGSVNGSVNCGGSCHCGHVSGDIDAGGSVRYTRD